MKFDETFKEALISIDAFTPVEVIYLDMENFLLFQLSPYATTELDSITAGQAAQVLSWSENFLEMTKEACPHIPPNPKWRKHIEKLLDHYLEYGVRKETRELLEYRIYDKDEDDMRKNKDGRVVTTRPEELIYIYKLQLDVAKDFLPQKYFPAVMRVCDEEIPKVISGRISYINENWQAISDARYCAIANDATRMSELLESHHDRIFTEYKGVETSLDISELEKKARVVETELSKISRFAVNRLCDKIIHDLHCPVPFITTVGSLEWETDEDGTAIEVTTTTVREYFADLSRWLNPNFFGLLSRSCFNLIFENYVNYFYKNILTRGVEDPKATSRRLLEDYATLESYFDGEDFERHETRNGRLRSKQEIMSILQILVSFSRLVDPEIKPRSLIADIKRILECAHYEGDQNEVCILHIAGLNGRLTKEDSLNWLKAIARAQKAILDERKRLGNIPRNAFQMKIPDLSHSPYIYRVKISKHELEKKLFARTIKFAEDGGKAVHEDPYKKNVMALSKFAHCDFSAGGLCIVPNLLSFFGVVDEAWDTGHSKQEERQRQHLGSDISKMSAASVVWLGSKRFEV